MIFGGDGNDRIDGGQTDTTGWNQIYAGSGNDTIYAAKASAGIGNPADGGDGADVYHGGDGTDTFVDGQIDGFAETMYGGLSGDKFILAVESGDKIFGGTGLDWAKLDFYKTGPVALNLDFHRIGTGHSVNQGGITLTDVEFVNVYGGAGNDAITGSETDAFQAFYDINGNIIDYAADNLFGRAGNDTIYGVGGHDLLSGDAGNDLLYGGDSEDSLYGGDGNDRVYGDAGNDTVFSSAGDDYEDGGDGSFTDTYSFAGLDHGVVIDISKGLASATDGRDTIVGFELFEGSNFSDKITLSAAAERIAAGSGDDSMYGMAGTDSLFGGLGNDALYGGADGDTLFGETGNDSLFGGDSNDALSGDDGDDSLFGGSGMDSLTGGAGADLLQGDADTDFLTGNTGADLIYGGAGNDRLTGDSASAAADDGNDSVYGGTGNDVVASGAGDDRVFGDEGDDSLVGGPGSDRLDGGAGDDLFAHGFSGADLFGGTGSDTAWFFLLGYLGTSVTVDLSTGSTVTAHWAGGQSTLTSIENITGSTGKDAITGSAAANVLDGSDGDDTILGGGGNDTLKGGSGVDLLAGGSGADEFRFEYLKSPLNPGPEASVDHITDFVHGQDRLAFWSLTIPDLGAVGALSPQIFVTGPVALDGDDRLIYDKPAGALDDDADGTGATAAILIAQFGAGTVVDLTDLFIV